MAPDEEKQEPESTTPRRRGTRGARDRAKGDGDGGSVLDDPRIAGRRPANPPAEDAPAEEPAKPATRRRAASTRRSTAKAEPADAEQAEATPAPRRRRGAAAAEAAEAEQAEAKPAPRRRRGAAAAEAAEAEQAEAKPAPRRRRGAAAAETAEAEQAEATPAPRRRRAAAAAETAEAEQAEATPAPRRRRAAAAAETAEAEQAEATPPRSRRGPAAAEPAEAEQAEAKPAPRRRRSTAAAAAAEATPDATALAEQLRAMQSVMEAQTQALDALREQQERNSRKLRLGVFVDVPNLIYGAERGEGGPAGATVDMGRLLDYLRTGRELIRAAAYAPVSDDPGEPVERQRFVAPFVPYDYRIVTKPLKRFADGSIKGNFDVEMAIDMVTMAERLDVVALVSGDADFSSVVELLQSRGVRVEVIAFSGSTSIEMRALADHYIDVGTMMDQVGV